MIAYDTDVSFDRWLGLIAAFVIGTIAVARITRLIVDDDFPPVVWLRERLALTLPRRWGLVIECPWCVAPYVTVVDMAWAWATSLHWTWWFGNVWAAVSWLAAFMSVRDIPPDQR